MENTRKKLQSMRRRVQGIKFKIKERKVLNYLIKKTRSVPIKKRLILSFSIIPIISVFLIGGFSYIKSKQALQSKIGKYSSELLQITNQNLYLNINSFERIFDELTLEPIVQYGLENNKRMSYEEKLKFTNNFDQYLSRKFSLLTGTSEIELVSKDGSIIYTQGFKYFKQSDIEKYSKMAEKVGGQMIWFSTDLNGEEHIAMARALKAEGTNLINGYLFIAVRGKALLAPLFNVDLGKGSNVILVDNEGKVLATQTHSVKLGSYMDKQKIFKEIKENKYGSMENVKLSGENYILNYSYMMRQNWYLVSTIPFKYIYEDSNEIRKYVLSISLICLIGITFVSIIIYLGINKPLQTLTYSMKEVMKENLDVRVEDEYNDELGFLARIFNNMIQRLKQLIDNIKNEQEMKRGIELRMLQAQINPHFLFNTLNSFKWLASMNQDYTVSEGLGALAVLLRNTIVDKNEMVTIQEELENIKNYIIIQKIRYGDTFTVDYNIEPQLLHRKIIKFILQPIVENSIIHAFDEKSSDQKLTIDIKSQDKDILIVIMDNGKGFKCIEEDKEKDKRLAGVGVKNVDSRIKLNFGNEYGITLHSQVGVGTKVAILIPNFHMCKEEN